MDSKINIAKMAAFYKLIYSLNTISIKSQLPFYRNRQADSKIPMESQGNQNSQNNLEKKKKLKDSYFSILKATIKLWQSK